MTRNFLDNEGYSGDLVRVALDGSDRTVLWTNDQSMRSIAANDTKLFFAENESGGRVLSVDKCGCP